MLFSAETSQYILLQAIRTRSFHSLLQVLSYYYTEFVDMRYNLETCWIIYSLVGLSTHYWINLPSPLLDNIRVMLIVWRLRGKIIRTAVCWIVWRSVESQQHFYEQILQVQLIGFHIATLTLCVEAVASSCIIVTWWNGAGGIQDLPVRPTGFLQCFDTVGLVIWPVKVVPNMTYNVFAETLNLAQSTTKVIES